MAEYHKYKYGSNIFMTVTYIHYIRIDEPLFRQCIKLKKTHKWIIYKCFGDNFCVEDLGNEDYNDFLKLLPPGIYFPLIISFISY